MADTSRNDPAEDAFRRLLSGTHMDEKRRRIESLKFQHRRVLNRLDPHRGCVVCRGPLDNGRCLSCDPREVASDG